MSQVIKFDLTPAAKPLTAALSAENAAVDKWKIASKAMYAAGLRYALIAGATQQKEVKAQVYAFIVSLMPEAKRKLLTIKGRDVAELSEAQKVARKMYQQAIGNYMGRLAKYLGKHEGVTAERKPKAAATAAPAAVYKAPENWGNLIAALTAADATCLKWKDRKGNAKTIAQVQDAVQTALALIRTMPEIKDEPAPM